MEKGLICIRLCWLGGRSADFLIFLKYPMKMKYFGLAEVRFHFHRIIKKGGGRRGGEGRSCEPPEPLWIPHCITMKRCL